jgi:hypothetical protein
MQVARSRPEGNAPGRMPERFFAYFFKALVKKVSRRKGETASRRYRSNGYALSPTT